MSKEIPYYTFDESGQSECVVSNGEAYIDDEDLRDLLIELYGDSISDDDIQRLLEAASDENMSEDDFDALVDEFILKNKK